ncbi:hypothetical protein FKP32DRAFT_662859 [Trametes sanguinea]|nr:hypothetical protein FKP32DRAFT_662859 [Trametes sanguinea]
MPWASSQGAVQRPRRAISRVVGWAYRQPDYLLRLKWLISLRHIYTLLSILYVHLTVVKCILAMTCQSSGNPFRSTQRE